MTRAAKALRKEFEGSRAEQIDGGAWRKFAMERLEQAAPDTVNYELSLPSEPIVSRAPMASYARFPNFRG